MPATHRMHCVDKTKMSTMRCVRHDTSAAQSSAHRPLQDEGPYAASLSPMRELEACFGVTPKQACPRPSGLGRNLRSKTRWFTGFCNSHQVSHFATFFIDARAEISVAESRLAHIWKAVMRSSTRERGGRHTLLRFDSLVRTAPGVSCLPGGRDKARAPNIGLQRPRAAPTPRGLLTSSRVVLPCRVRQ